jgi:hypothetical protein
MRCVLGSRGSRYARGLGPGRGARTAGGVLAAVRAAFLHIYL